MPYSWPDEIYNSGVVTVQIEAVSLTNDGVIELISPNNDVLTADNITFTMQFPGGSPPGEVPQPATQQADDVWPWEISIFATFDLTGADQEKVWTSLVMPEDVSPGKTFTFTFQYGNDGQTNAPAPLITVQVPSGIAWELDGIPIVTQTYTFLATGLSGPAGSLMPNQVESIEFMASWDGSGGEPAIMTWPTTSDALVAPVEMIIPSNRLPPIPI